MHKGVCLVTRFLFPTDSLMLPSDLYTCTVAMHTQTHDEQINGGGGRNNPLLSEGHHIHFIYMYKRSLGRLMGVWYPGCETQNSWALDLPFALKKQHDIYLRSRELKFKVMESGTGVGRGSLD